MKILFPLTLYLAFLLLIHSNTSKSLYSKSKFLEFNQNDFKDEEKIENSPIDILTDTDNKLNLTIKDNFNKNILKVGQKGIIYFVTDYNDYKSNIFDASDIEEKTKFDTIIKDEELNEYNATCKLWKPNYDYIRIICNLDENLKNVDNNIALLNSVQIEYKDYKIEISQEKYIKAKQLNCIIPFLYSDVQNIEIQNNIESYNFKFKFESYNNDILFIYSQSYNFATLENCNINGNELKCELSKIKLEEILGKNNDIFKVKVINDDVGVIQMDFILNITINYTFKKKEDIYVNITKCIHEHFSKNAPFVFETNITYFPNIISGLYSTCYFKKTKGNPLLFLCISDNYFVLRIEKELILSNIHYKYNFIIKPYSVTFDRELFKDGTNINLIYPEILNFTLTESLIIRYIMPNPSLVKSISMNIHDDLKCDDLDGMKKCTVPLSHFKGKKSGYYNTYYYYDDFDYKYLKYYEISPIYVEKLIDYNLVMYIEKKDNPNMKVIGDYGVLYYITDYNDNEDNIFNSSDIEERTTIKTFLTSFLTHEKYAMACRLWKPSYGNIRLFCKMEENLPNENQFIQINQLKMNYGKYNISINFYFNLVEIKKTDYIPFLYSSEQIINIDDEKDSYNLKFNIEQYNKDILYIKGNYLNTKILDNCYTKEKELICQIKKEDLIGILPTNGGNLFLYFYLPGRSVYGNDEQYKNVLNIAVNVKNLTKENIYVGINKILDNALQENNFAAFETNVTNISNLITDMGQCKLGEKDYSCYLKKDPDKPLLILFYFFEGNYTLRELLNHEIILDNINVKYNFRIQSSNNTEKFSINGNGQNIRFAYPKILNFKIIKEYKIYFSYSSRYLNIDNFNLRLAPDLEDINCQKDNLFKFSCIVNSDYFDNYANGYYNLYHLNRLNNYSIYYEVQPFEVILPKNRPIVIKIKEKDNNDTIIFGEKGIISLVTNFNDNKRNIFDASDIEDKTKFQTRIYGDMKSNIIYCRLWKPNNDNLRIICKVNKYDLDSQTHKLFLSDKVILNYNEYIINIPLEITLNIRKFNYDIPFLYSNRQTIEIKDDIKSYNLKFKIETYNNESLYLYGEVNNSLIIDKCQKNENEINCEVSKEKLEEVLVKHNEQFRVGAIKDNVGLIKFRSVLNITINYEINKKEDIYIEIIGSLTNKTAMGVPFGFKTNVSNLPNIYSDISNNCYFKKFNGHPLLYLCRIDETTEEPFKFGNISDEMILNNLHYKYNFRIKPFEELYNVNISGYGTKINLFFPEVLDFTKEDTLTITLILPSPGSLHNTKLNPISEVPFECSMLNTEINKCNISVAHFSKQKSDNFYLYYSKTERYYDLPPINVMLPKSIIEIPVKLEDNRNNIYIGDRGLLYFKTNYNDTETNIFDISDIEEKTSFTTTIFPTSYLSNNVINCRLWKPLNDKIWLFCKLNENFKKETEDEINIKNAVFHYNEHTIGVIFHFDRFKANIMNISVPLLYSNKQTIYITEEIDTYELQFHIDSYNKQPLCLSLDEMRNITLQDCKENGKDLICNITKEKFYEIHSKSGQKLKLYPCEYSLRKIEFPSVHDIIINFDSIKKKEVTIKKTKIINNNVRLGTFLAFETDVMNISDIISDKFENNLFLFIL